MAVNRQLMGYEGSEYVFPLNPVKVMVVGAALKKAGYRGPKKYFTAMKQLHISEGYPWASQLAQALHWFNMSTARVWGAPDNLSPCPLRR